MPHLLCLRCRIFVENRVARRLGTFFHNQADYLLARLLRLCGLNHRVVTNTHVDVAPFFVSRGSAATAMELRAWVLVEDGIAGLA